MTEVQGYAGSISFDGQTVVIRKKMRGETRVPIGAVSGVAIVPAGIGMRAVKVMASGSDGVSASVGGSHKDLAGDPYALTFRRGKAGEFEALVGEIETARAG